MERGTPGYELVDKTEDLLLSIGRKLGIQNPFAAQQAVIKENREGQIGKEVTDKENIWIDSIREGTADIAEMLGSAYLFGKIPTKSTVPKLPPSQHKTINVTPRPDVLPSGVKGGALTKTQYPRTQTKLEGGRTFIDSPLLGTYIKGAQDKSFAAWLAVHPGGTEQQWKAALTAQLKNKISNPDQGDLFEAAELAQYQKDMRNPNISLPVRYDLAQSVLGSSYRTSEPFDYFKFREQSKYMRDKGRRFLAYFQAGLTQYGASKATSFDIYRKTTTPKLEQEYKKGLPLSSFQIQYKDALKVLYNSNSKPEEIEAALKTINDPQVQGLPSSSFQVHHKAALKAIMGISHGLDFDSPVFREVMGIIIEEIPWLGLGDESTNLMPIIGSTADRGTPHYLAHRFYNKILGPKGQGEEFFTEEVIERMMIDREFRREKAREIGQIIKRSNDIVTRATRLWELGFSNKHHFKSLDHLVDNLSQFDELGYEELSDPNYEAPIVTAIIDEIVRDGQLLPPVEKNERRQQILQDLLRLKELQDDEISADAQRKRDLKGPDNPDQEELF